MNMNQYQAMTGDMAQIAGGLESVVICPALECTGFDHKGDPIRFRTPQRILPTLSQFGSSCQDDAYTHTSPRSTPQTAQAVSCDYCLTMSSEERCPSCGAPRRARKQRVDNEAEQLRQIAFYEERQRIKMAYSARLAAEDIGMADRVDGLGNVSIAPLCDVERGEREGKRLSDSNPHTLAG